MRYHRGQMGTSYDAANIVSPSPSTNKVFTQALAKTLNRPAFLPLPAPVAKLLLGEMAEELLLSSTRVRPKKLLDSGFVFKHKDIYEAFNSILM